MKNAIAIVMAVLVLAVAGFAQTPPPAPQPQSPFQTQTVSINLAALHLPGIQNTVTGAESDIDLSLTPNNLLAQTAIVSSNYSFIGGRYERQFAGAQKWLNNLSPSLNGYNFMPYLIYRKIKKYFPQSEISRKSRLELNTGRFGEVRLWQDAILMVSS